MRWVGRGGCGTGRSSKRQRLRLMCCLLRLTWCIGVLRPKPTVAGPSDTSR